MLMSILNEQTISSARQVVALDVTGPTRNLNISIIIFPVISLPVRIHIEQLRLGGRSMVESSWNEE